MQTFETVVGLEIHAELNTSSKVFCSCESVFGEKENSRICPHCAGIPGALPSLNKKAVELAIRAGIAFGCEIQRYSAFDRKNYCYPDLPKAYQITQFYYPIALGGFVSVGDKNYPLIRIHIEEDAGKLTHLKEENISLADYNRCGVPLIEIVSEPCLCSAKEAAEFFRQVALILKYTDVCDCKMQEGSLRCDVNISVRPSGSEVLGTRTEIKNLNSFRAVFHAIEKETQRQTEILKNGQKVLMQTLHFDDISGILTVLRTKEGEDDYRYFPEPDLPAVILSENDIEIIKESMPELPQKRLERMKNTLGLSLSDAELITAERKTADLFEEAAAYTKNYKTLTSLFVTELPRIKRENPMAPARLTPSAVGGICNMVEEEKINKNSAKEIFEELYLNGGNPKEIAERKKLLICHSEEEIISAVKEVLFQNPKALEEYKGGSEKVFGFFMGQVTKRLGGSSNPATVKVILKRELERKKTNP